MTTDTTETVVETTAPDANVIDTSPESSPGAVDTSDKSEKGKDPIQRRIDKLTWQLRHTERERDYERELRLQNLQQRSAPEKQVTTQSQPLKKLADFSYDEDAYADYLADVAADKAAAKLEGRQASKESEKSRKDKVAKFKEIESKFKTEIEDYEDVAYYARIDDHVVDLVMDMDEGPRIAYYLGKHPDIASRINSLSKDLAAVELGRIDARLAIEREQVKAAKPVSKAPPPPPKIDATDSAVEKDPTQMTDKEFAKWRKQYASKR